MEYVGLTDKREYFPDLPSVAMNFNGRYIEEVVEGYRTLNVSGREMLGYDIQSERRSHGHGSIRYGKTLPSRVITVQYLLKAENPAQLQYRFDELRKALYSKDIVPITFADEPGVTYYGELESTETVPADRLSVISTFNIFCPDPFKYRNAIVTGGEVVIDTFYPTIPQKILVTTSTATNAIDISNGKQVIQLRGEVNAGTDIHIDIENQSVSANGVERLDLIDLHSDFENFTVENGQTVTTSNGTLKLHVREVV